MALFLFKIIWRVAEKFYLEALNMVYGSVYYGLRSPEHIIFIKWRLPVE